VLLGRAGDPVLFAEQGNIEKTGFVGHQSAGFRFWRRQAAS
jgi:hypothetical protein